MTPPVRFKVADLATEVEIMQKLAKDFLDPGCIGVLRRLKESIDTLKHSTQEMTISVGSDWPIRTVPCRGGYERGERGGRKELFGELLLKWVLRPLPGTEKERQVEIAGIASNLVRLKAGPQGQEVIVASWRMEVGDGNGPGALFHSQIPDSLEEGNHSEERDPLRMWPRWLPVPRLPIPPMTPMLALEFILAEIFQDGWPRHLSTGSQEVNRWSNLQRQRYATYFEWQKNNALESGQGSPILATKNAAPDPEIFLP